MKRAIITVTLTISAFLTAFSAIAFFTVSCGKSSSIILSGKDASGSALNFEGDSGNGSLAVLLIKGSTLRFK